MEQRNIILIAIAVLVIILVGVGIYVMGNGNGTALNNMTDTSNHTGNNATNTTAVNKTADNSTNQTNKTNKTVGDNSPRKNITHVNKTYKVYNPQSDSYVTVIGEKFDKDVNRWYTYDTDGVRYYNTRIN
ncbi:hypothetical protein [Methanobrevibacter sp.]|uniref:hypothetical protein n=1 Tax=Methanobrevibacter sp. TaxID=66852 RepID=UPI00388CFE5B